MSGRASIARAPKTRSCYICGRQYMLHSFVIHEQQCRDLFEKWENQKPPKERRRCPDDPMRGYDPNMSMKDLDRLNAASQQTWSEQALVRCQNCNRTFLPEKLPIHQRSCTAANPAKRVEDPVASRDSRSSENTRVSSRFQQNDGDYGGGESEYVNVNSGNMMQCKNCGRKFNTVSYSKHAKVCAKVFTQSRKVFNSAKQRIQGTDLEEYNRQAMKKGSSGTKKQTSGGTSGPSSSGATTRASVGGGEPRQAIPKWKLDSMKFRMAMKAAREVSRAEKQSKETGVPLHLLLPAKPSRSSMSGYGDGGYGNTSGDYDDPPDGLRCPTCGRTFNQKAGERHIPQCKNIINKPSRLTKGSGAPSYSTSSPEGKGPGGGTFGSGVRVLGNSVGGAGAATGSKQVGRLDFDSETTSVNVRSSGAPNRGGGGGGVSVPVRSGGLSNTVGRVPGSSSRPGSAGLPRGNTTTSDRFAQSAVVSNNNAISTRGGIPLRYSTTSASGATAVVTSASARPSPRVSDARAARGSFSGGLGSSGARIGEGGGRAAGGGGGASSGSYRISQSNATSSDNPILGNRN